MLRFAGSCVEGTQTLFLLLFLHFSIYLKMSKEEKKYSKVKDK